MDTYSLLEALDVDAAFKEILARRHERSLVQLAVLDAVVDVDEREVRRIQRIADVLAAVLLETQLVLQERRLRQRFDVVANRRRFDSFHIRLRPVPSVVRQQHDFDLSASSLLLLAFAQMLFVPLGSFSDGAVIAVVRRFLGQPLDVSVAAN